MNASSHERKGVVSVIYMYIERVMSESINIHINICMCPSRRSFALMTRRAHIIFICVLQESCRTVSIYI